MKRLVLSFVLFALWLAVTVGGGSLANKGHGGLEELVKNGIGWHFLLASLLLVVAIRVFGWRDISFAGVPMMPTVRLLWLPVAILAVFAVLAVASGLPGAAVVFFVGANTLMVGFSEETMLRGVVYTGLRRQLRVWPAVASSSILFGAMHSLNVFATGELLPALLQSVAAAMSGLLFGAIVVRTGSLVPAIVYHWLWDFATFLVAVSSGEAVPEASIDSPALILVPFAVVLPNFLFGLWLLRKVPNGGPLDD